MAKFQRLAVMVTNISEVRLIMLFIEGIEEPLRGWVRAYRPVSLQADITRTRDMINVVP